MSKKIKPIIEEKFEEIFNLPPMDDIEGEIVEEEKTPVTTAENNDVDTDYEYARANLYGLIESGSNALNDLVEVAGQSQSPRAYEIVSQLIKTLTDANKDLLEVQSKVKKLKEETNKGPNNVTNALFIGNTTELQKMIKDRKKDV
jgi:hypothetical protein